MNEEAAGSLDLLCLSAASCWAWPDGQSSSTSLHSNKPGIALQDETKGIRRQSILKQRQIKEKIQMELKRNELEGIKIRPVIIVLRNSK